MRKWPANLTTVVLGFATIVGSQSLFAQAPCTLAWQPGDGIPGLDGTAYAMANWDPDGAGPQPEMVVVGGSFAVAGDVMASNIALYDPGLQRWSALGGGVPQMVVSIRVRSNGQLVVGSNLGVHEWNGTAWQALGPTFNGQVGHLAELANGDLVAGGTFGAIGGSQVFALARWDGSQWQAMGDPSMPFSAGTIQGMGVLPNGDLVVGGLFDQIGGVACSHVAKWNGATWQPLGSGSAIPVSNLVVTAVGDVVAMGSFSTTFGVSRWTGSAWTALPPGIPAGALPFAPSGASGVLFRTTTSLWLLDAAGWSVLVPWTQAADVRCAALLANGDVVVGGSFLIFEGLPAQRVAHRRAGVWGSTGSGGVGGVTAIAATPSGDIFVGGTFTQVGGVSAAGVARFDGNSWSPLGFSAQLVFDIAVRDDGEAVFAVAGAAGSGPGLVSWRNGVVTPIPLQFGGPVAVSVVAAGAGATFVVVRQGTSGQVARWDGSFLVPSSIQFTGTLADMVEMPNGDLVFAGNLQGPVVGSLVRWDGQQLLPIAGAPASVVKLCVAANGDLLVGSTAGGVARWDGAMWQSLPPLANGVIRSLDTLPNGDVIVAEGSSSVPSVTRVRRWDGVQWTTIGVASGPAWATWVPSGAVALGGSFSHVDNAVAGVFSLLRSSCPADAQDLGGGCSGSAGPLTTRIDERAWLGGTFQATTLGVPTNALALGVLGGTAITVPLSQLLPIGGAGCTLRTSPDAVGPLPVSNGTAMGQWPVPSAPALLGGAFVQQTVVLESAAGTPTALVASQALQLTIGAF